MGLWLIIIIYLKISFLVGMVEAISHTYSRIRQYVLVMWKLFLYLLAIVVRLYYDTAPVTFWNINIVLVGTAC